VTDSLPLFPLGTVLFPGLVLPLHVFEERYRLLVRELVEGGPAAGARFGVVAIRSGREVGAGLPDLHDVGCTAELRRVEPYEDGRFDIVTTGGARFRVRELDTSRPYLTGEVDQLPEDVGEATAAAGLARRVRAGFAAYLLALGAAHGSDSTPPELPDLPTDPMTLSYLVAAAVLVDVPDKQRLLAATDAADRLRLELSLLSQETGLLRALSAPPALDLTSQAFSAN